MFGSRHIKQYYVEDFNCAAVIRSLRQSVAGSDWCVVYIILIIVIIMYIEWKKLLGISFLKATFYNFGIGCLKLMHLITKISWSENDCSR